MERMTREQSTHPTIIHILGTGHSGSTLLELLLAAHPEAFATGESERLDSAGTLLCTCGQLAYTCPVWSTVYEMYPSNSLKVFRSKMSFLFNIPRFRNARKPHERINEEGYIHASKEIYKKLSEVTGADTIVESSKNTHRMELLARDCEIPLVGVHVVRDARAVTWSYLKKRKKYGGKIAPFLKWIFINIKMEIVKRRLRNVRWIYVTYEDMIENPQEVVHKILAEAGLSSGITMDAFRTAKHHQIAGNRLRFSDDRSIKPHAVWQTEMPAWARVLTTICTLGLNRYYQHKESGRV